MIDVELSQSTKGYDILIQNGDIAAVNNFKTAIEVSLFTDARADATQIFLPEARRGWIGNIATPIENQDLGSLIWLVSQARLTQSTLNKVVIFARQALQWLVTQGQAVSVNVSGQIVPTFGIRLNIVIESATGITENHYVELWENTKNAN